MTYQEQLAILKERSFYPLEGEFYEYDDFPLSEEFHAFWTYGQEFLERTDLGFELTNPVLYFNTNTSTNAVAFHRDGVSAVEIFKGTLFSLHYFFDSKGELFESDILAPYKELTAAFKVSPQFYLFQFVSLLFLYHETGHLIQRNGLAESNFEFMLDKCQGREAASHVKEFDADWFATNQLAIHIANLNQKIFEEFVIEDRSEFLHKSAELALASIYIFMVTTSQKSPDLYYEEWCHPHPSVRLIYMIFYFIDTIKFNIEMEMDENRLLKNAIAISIELMNDQNPNPIETYSLEMYKNLDDIDQYIRKLQKNCNNYPQACRNNLD